MLAALGTKVAILTVVAAVATFSGRAFAALQPHHGPATFGTTGSYVTRLDTDVESGTLRQVACAPGAQPGASCWVAR